MGDTYTGDDAWYVTVRDSSFEARLGRGAMIHLADHLVEDESSDQGIALTSLAVATSPS